MTDFANQLSIEALIQVASSAVVNQVTLEPWNVRNPDAFAAVYGCALEIWWVPSPTPVPVSTWFD